MNISLTKSAFHLMTIRGIPIRIHISLPILLGYFFLRGLGIGIGTAISSLIIGILVFASVALHELGHSFTAIRFGHRVRDIVLTLIGGVARLESIPRDPRQEILVALAGPAVSLTLAALGMVAGGKLFTMGHMGDMQGLMTAGGLLYVVGKINLALALFNLLPCFPMDGGRVFRAALTRRWGRLKATEMAMRAGQTLCVVLIISGVFGLPEVTWLGFDQPSLFRVLIGFFIFNAAKSDYQMVMAEETMRQRGFANPLEVLFGGRSNPQPPPPPRMRMRRGPRPPDEVDDTVEVGPSPYEDGQGSRTHVERD
jgi:Zn-dependent protease